MILLTARTSFKRKKKLEREQHDGNIWKAETERHERDRGWKREKRKKNDSRSVKESQNGFSTCEKKKEGHCYKFPRPALDLIWAGMQTTHRSSLNRVLRVECECMRACVCACVCVCVGGWRIGCQGDSDISGPTPCCPQFSLDKSEKTLCGGPANLQSRSLSLSLSLSPSLPPAPVSSSSFRHYLSFLGIKDVGLFYL